MQTIRNLLMSLALLCVLGFSRAQAFTHPCVPTSLHELDTIKANLDKQPWKSGYAGLAGASTSQLSWPQEGPWETVSRTPDVNLTYWKNDMNALYNLSLMWNFTGNEAYAQKAHDIILSWATTQTSFSGHETPLSLGDFAVAYAGGASILRGTWPGWTAEDTATVKKYFENVTWPRTIGDYNTPGPANKGMLTLEAGIAVAAFLDDTEKFNHCIDLYRTSPASGLLNTLPTGEMGETGRDLGHSYGTMIAMAVLSEIAWKQGVDLYSELDNRLLAVGEYYARNALALDNPFVPFGTIDYNYYVNNSYYFTPDTTAFLIIQNAYKNRMGIPTPWIDRRLETLGGGNLMYSKTADFSTATPLAPVVRPPVSLASSGLTLTTLGDKTTGRSLSYSNGEWTMAGLGSGVVSDSVDDCQFAYTAMTGDCAIVVQVTSCSDAGAGSMAGVMIRDNLSSGVSQRGWVGIVPSTINKVESRNSGWTDNWGGSNWARRAQDLPPGMPYWLKMERRGNMIASYTSQDGTSWAANINSYYANLPATVYIGTFVLTGNTTTPTTATFANVAFTGGSGGLVTTPAAPATLMASGSGKAITVRWVPSFGATAYDLLRSTTSGSGYTVIASDLTADKTSYVDTNVSSGTTYYYVARAKNSVGTSGNSPEFDAALLPARMANLATTGTANDDQGNPDNAGNAFDQNAGSLWFHGGGTTGWLEYDFGAGTPQVVKRYTINSATLIPERDPKDWQFQASDDGTNWVTLDTQTNQTFTYRMQRNTYDISNTTAYRYYRFNVTANNGHPDILHLGDIGLWSDSGRTIPDGRYVLVSRNSNKVMEVTGSADGAQVVQQTFDGDDTQMWDIQWQGNGQYSATNVASAKVLDNSGTSTEGGNLVIQPSGGGDSQLWTIEPDSDGFFHITSANSGLVADVSGGSTADGANIIQNTYNGSDSQLWMPSLAVKPQPAPLAPTGVTATPASIYQIDLSWAASSGAISYNIKRATTSGGPYTTIAEGVNTTTYTDTGLSAGTTYYYVISAVNGSGEGADSVQASATTPANAPAAPTGLTTILGTGRFTLSWAATGGATSYTVKRATTSGGPYTTIASGWTNPLYTDTTITSGVTYYYVIAAINAFGSSPDSAETVAASGTLGVHLKFDETGGDIAVDSSGYAHDATLVNGPVFGVGILDNALNLAATSSQYATLPEGIASGLTDFTIATWIKCESFATWQRIFDFGTGTDNYMMLTEQGPAGTGRPRFAIATPSDGVQSIDSSIALPVGAWTHVAVTRSGDTVSIYVNGTLAGSGTITLSPADLGFTTQNYLGESQFPDPYLNAALDDFRIYSEALSPAEITDLAQPTPGAPKQFTAVPGENEVTLSWDPDGTTSYTVKRSTTSGGPYTTIASSITATSYTDTSLTNDVTYYYVVTGANGGGSGPDSAEVSVTPSDLAIHLKFDETSGSVAADSSGRSNDATLVNGPTFAAGQIDNAINLDAASTQYVTLPDGIVSGLNDFTLSTWIKVNSFASWQRIFDFGTGTDNYMFLTTQGLAGAGRPRFAIRTPSVGEQIIDSSIALTTGVWTHVAVIRSGDTVSIYIDGSLAGSSTITLKPSDLGVTTQNYLGKSQWPDPYLDSALDDFRIYVHALSSADVINLANQAPTQLVAVPDDGEVSLSWRTNGSASYTVKRSTTSGGSYTTIASDITDTTYTDTGVTNDVTYYYVVIGSIGGDTVEVSATPSTLVLDLKFDETSGTVAADSSGRSNDATLVNGPTFAAGQIDNAINLDAASTQYVTLPDDIVSGLTDFTLSTWIKVNSFASWQRIFDFGTGTDNYMFLTTQGAAGAGRPRFAIRTPSVGEQIIDSSIALTTGVWTHIAITRSGDTVSIYIDGNLAGSGSITLNPADLGITTGTYLGKSQWPDPYLDAALDDFRIYSQALSAPEVSDLAALVSAPSGLTATAGSGQVSLSWDPVSGATSYNVKRSATSGGPYTLLQGNVTETSYTDSAVTNGSTYYYVVSAVDNASNESANSAESSATPVDTTAPAAPTGLGTTAGDGNVSLDWADNSEPDLASYTVYRSITSGSGYASIVSGLSTSAYTDNAVTNGTTYYYVVSAVDNASNESANSAESSATPADTTAPAAPTGLGATAGEGTVSLDWADNSESDLASYTVYRSTTSGSGYASIASGLSTSAYTDNTVTNGTTYYYVVTATDNVSNESGASTEVSAMPVDTTAPAAPTGLSATAGDSSVSLDWADNSEPDLASYTVYRSTTSGSGYASIASGLSTSAYTDTGLTNGTTYYYVVSAVDTASNESAFSSEASAIPSDLALHLKFDETDGTNAADSSVRVFDATLVNGPAFSGGRIGNALVLDAASSQHATLPSGIVSDFNDFTFSTWIKVNSFATWQRVFDFGTGTNNNMYLTTQGPAGAGRLRFNVLSSGVEQFVDSSIALTTGVWTHVAVTRSGDTVSIYIDGSLVGSGTITLKPSDLGVTTQNYLGKSQWSVDPYLDAALDDFRIYNRALTAGEIALFQTQPDAPTGLAATPGDAQVQLTWDAVTDATSYKVLRSLTSGGPYSLLQENVTETSFTDSVVTNGSTYYYVVSAVDSASNESANSAESSATPADTTAPAAPTGLSATAGDGTVSLDWADNSEPDLASYTVYRSTSSGSGYASIASGLSTSAYTDDTVTNGVTYYYVVTATDNVSNESGASTEVTAMPVDTTAPAAPTGLGATAGDGNVSLDWADNSEPDFASYTVYRSTTSGSGYASIASGLSTSTYTDNAATNGTTYYYVVTATDNASNESANSAESSATPVDTTAPTAPTGLGATAGDGTVSLDWADNSEPDFASYTVYRSTTSGSGYASIASGLTSSVYTDNAVTNGTTYYYVVTATDSVSNESANSAESSATPVDTTAPTAPTALGATAGDGSVSLDWADNTEPDFASYTVYRSTTSGSGYASIASGLSTSAYTDNTVTNGTTYYYVVTATDNVSNESANSTESSATPADTIAPAAPTGLSATAGDSSVSLGWADNSEPDFASYTVYRSTTSGSGYASIASGLSSSAYTDNAVTNGVTYYYVVSAVDTASNESANSAESSATPADTTAPAAPAALGATAGDGSVSLDWADNSEPDLASYTVYRSTTSGSGYSAIASSLGSSDYTDNSVSNGTTYYYVVTATDAASNESANSAESSATPVDTTPPAAPTGLVATAGDSSVSLDWADNSEPDFASYTVYRSTASGSGYASIASGLSASAYTDNAVTNGTTYYYVVTATDNVSNESANSSEMSAMPQVNAPDAPTGLVATPISIGQVDLSWDASTGADSYNVKWAGTSGGPYTDLATDITSTSYSDIGMLAGSTNYYVVSAVNAGGESANSAEASAVTPELVAYLPFDETSGTTAADSSPNGFDGTLVNGPAWATGIVTNSVLLDGIDDYVVLPSGIVADAGNFTIATWVYLNTTSTWSRIFDFGSGTTTNMFLTPNNGENGNVRFAITTSGGNGEQRIDGSATLPTNIWTHVAVTWNNGVGILYVDGIAVGTNNTMTLYPAALGDTTQNYIGKSQYPDPYLDGAVDDFRIIGRALSAAEIATLAASVPQYDNANADVPVSGTVSGGYADTQASDNAYETITEFETGGKPGNRYSYLEHKWTINVTGGNSLTFNVEAYKTANGEGDNFVFAYSTDNVSYTDMVTITKTADDNLRQSYVLPGNLSGTVYIRVTDTDRTPGNRGLDSVYIDELNISAQ